MHVPSPAEDNRVDQNLEEEDEAEEGLESGSLTHAPRGYDGHDQGGREVKGELPFMVEAVRGEDAEPFALGADDADCRAAEGEGVADHKEGDQGDDED